MSQLTTRRITPKYEDIDRIKSLYLSAFPMEERAPFAVLLRRTKSESVHFLAFYEGKQFCGFAYLMLEGRLASLMYLAVEESLRSRGYGTIMIDSIRAYCGDRTVIVDIEQVVPGAENYNVRERRRGFYLRNGFHAAGCGYSLRKVDYEILVSGSDFSPEAYAALIRHYSAGMVRLDIRDYEGPTIREVHEDDLDALLHLYLHLHEKSVPEQSDALSQIWNGILSSPDYHIIVAEQNEKIVSSCTCVIIANLTQGLRPYALIENVVTDKAYRGRGMASACIRHALHVAEQAGCYKAMLLTGAKDKKTLEFYRRNGFNSNDKTAFIRWL